MTGVVWLLRTITGDLPEQIFRIGPGDSKTLGRANAADFVLEAAMLSRVHCRLTIAPSGDLEVRDLGSTNGTFVNDERVDVGHLRPGDRLRVGRVELLALRETE